MGGVNIAADVCYLIDNLSYIDDCGLHSPIGAAMYPQET